MELNRRNFIAVSVASAAALAAGCDPCDCNDTLCQDLKPYEFSWSYVGKSSNFFGEYDEITVVDKVLNSRKNGYIISVWSCASHDDNFILTRDMWLNNGMMTRGVTYETVDGEWQITNETQYRISNGYLFRLVGLEFEPVC